MKLTHLDDSGAAHMVDVGAKVDTKRVAVAKGTVLMQSETLKMITEGEIAKGDTLAVARVAGIMAAKQTPAMIPLCHSLLLTHVSVDLQPGSFDHGRAAIQVRAEVHTTGKTGAEMEALAAVSTAALTVYDMCKAVDRGMTITDIRLVCKSGGKSGTIILEDE